MKAIATFILTVVISFHCVGHHILSSSVTYEKVNTDVYRFTVALVTDCSGLDQFGQCDSIFNASCGLNQDIVCSGSKLPKLFFRNSDGDCQTFQFLPEHALDVQYLSSFNEKYKTTCNDLGPFPGYALQTFEADVVLPQDSVWEFIYPSYARENNITTNVEVIDENQIQIGTTVHGQAIDSGLSNYQPKTDVPWLIFVRPNIPIYYNFGLTDYVDYDSIIYELVHPLSHQPFERLNYNNNLSGVEYTPQEPIEGSIDVIGDGLFIKPTHASGSVFAIKATEFRNNEVISETVHDGLIHCHSFGFDDQYKMEIPFADSFHTLPFNVDLNGKISTQFNVVNLNGYEMEFECAAFPSLIEEVISTNPGKYTIKLNSDVSNLDVTKIRDFGIQIRTTTDNLVITDGILFEKADALLPYVIEPDAVTIDFESSVQYHAFGNDFIPRDDYTLTIESQGNHVTATIVDEDFGILELNVNSTFCGQDTVIYGVQVQNELHTGLLIIDGTSPVIDPFDTAFCLYFHDSLNISEQLSNSQLEYAIDPELAFFNDSVIDIQASGNGQFIIQRTAGVGCYQATDSVIIHIIENNPNEIDLNNQTITVLLNGSEDTVTRQILQSIPQPGLFTSEPAGLIFDDSTVFIGLTAIAHEADTLNYELIFTPEDSCTPTSSYSFTIIKQDDISSIDELANTIEIHPNPFNDLISVNSNDAQIKSITLYNEQGKIVSVKQDIVNQNEVNIDTKALHAGVYFLKVKYSSSSQTVKVVKH